MKSISISAIFAAAMAFGVASAQLPDVKPTPALPDVKPPPALPDVVPPPVSNTPTSQTMVDETITNRVTSAIASDPQLKELEFTVETTDSVVTINGTATATDQIMRALAIARSVPGVKSVTNILAVKTS
jgi:hyperosmotically inducible protein